MSAGKKRAKPVRKSPKRAAKSSGKSSARVGVPQEHGGVLIPGAGGGAQPGAGRPKNEFKQWCVDLLDDVDNRKQVEDILKDKGHPAYATMFRTIADRAHGKPKEHVQVDVNVSVAEALEAARLRAKNR
jgi:hypothetical protein